MVDATHDVATQLEALELLRAMYPLESELELSDETADFLKLVDDNSGSLDSLKDIDIPETFQVVIHLQVDDESLSVVSDESTNHELEVVISLGTRGQEWRVTVVPRQPGWMSRVDFEQLLWADTVPCIEAEQVPSEYILETIDNLKARASTCARAVDTRRSDLKPEEDNALDTTGPQGRLERVWFWFPSLSSKEKRRDLVDYTAEYDLKGFVLAGKPGLLCLEGDGSKVDKYLSAIKSQSWSDIPSYQKKVTERLRKPLESSQRRFTDMKDITSLIPQYGQYNHRGEMSEVKRLMDSWGVGEDFGVVVMNTMQ